MTIRYQRAPGTLKIERVDDGGAVTRAQVDEALAGLASDVDAAAATVRALRTRIRVMTADARHRHAIRERLSVRLGPGRVPGLTGAHVRRARQLLGKGQREVAAFCGVHRSSVAEAERGTRQVPEPVGRWALGVLRAAGEWEDVEG